MANARAVEAALLARCVAVARGEVSLALDEREANVLWVGASVVGSRFPLEAGRLRQASEQYFAVHPGTRRRAGEVVQRGWVVGLPRLRDMLSRELDLARRDAR